MRENIGWIMVCACFLAWCIVTQYTLRRTKKTNTLLLMAFEIIDELEEPARRGADNEESWKILGRLEAFNRQVEVAFPKEFKRIMEKQALEENGGL